MVRLRSAVYIQKDNHVLLILDPVYRGGCWILPGGGVEFNENIFQGAQREVFEETGLIVTIESLCGIREIWENENKINDGKLYVRRSLEFIFIGKYKSGEIKLEANKNNMLSNVANYIWHPISQKEKYINNIPIYPEELFQNNYLEKIQKTPINNIFLNSLDLRGNENK